MLDFTRPGSSPSITFVTVLSIALLAAGASIVPLDDATMDSSTPASIVVVKPNGGQVVASQNNYTIRWIAQGIDIVRIEYSLDGGGKWFLITDAAAAVTGESFNCPQPMLSHFLPEAITKSMGSYVWNVPDTESGEVLIRILDKHQPSVCDVSDKPFTIARRVSGDWTMQSVGTSPGLISVSIVDDSVAWTSGWNGAVFQTRNGGSNWTQCTSLPHHGTCVFGLNANTAFVCVNLTNDGRVYRTTDGGTSWTLALQHAGPSASINDVRMFGDANGVAIGNPVGGLWRVFKTSNGGATWDTLSRIPEPGFGYRDATDWVGEQQGWFGTDGGFVYRTTDGGSTWSPSDLGSLDVFSLVFPDGQLGLASTAFRYAYRTTNGGASWSYVSTIPAPHPAVIVSFIAGAAVPTPRWWATSLDEIYRSTNHGLLWTYETLADGRPFNDISMKHLPEKGLIVGYAVTAAADGVVMRYREVVTSTPEDQSYPWPLSLQLHQNYPNPFNPLTSIEFRLPKSGPVTLKVYDILGQEVRTLVNEPKEAGVHRVQFDASGLTSGVYVYRIENGRHTVSRKMVLLK